jgi:hypothetical protein
VGGKSFYIRNCPAESKRKMLGFQVAMIVNTKEKK